MNSIPQFILTHQELRVVLTQTRKKVSIDHIQYNMKFNMKLEIKYKVNNDKLKYDTSITKTLLRHFYKVQWLYFKSSQCLKIFFQFSTKIGLAVLQQKILPHSPAILPSFSHKKNLVKYWPFHADDHRSLNVLILAENVN